MPRIKILLTMMSITVTKALINYSFKLSFSKASLSSYSAMTSNIISVSEAIALHDDARIFIDGSWHLSSRDSRTEYEAGPRIKNAKFFDIDDVATKEQGFNLPHMMPNPHLFAKVMDEFEVSPDSNVILYGTEGCFSLARTLYTFKSMGHKKVHIMQGSLKDWIDAGGPIENEMKESLKVENLSLESAIKYDKAVDAMNVVGVETVSEVVREKESAQSIIVDARSAGRFVGEAPEPRPGLRGGHIPASKNVPFNKLLIGDNKFLPKEDMIQIFKEAGVDVLAEKDIICTCGSGVTACWLALAMEECGRDPDKTFVFDGSWIQWASDEKNPVVKN